MSPGMVLRFIQIFLANLYVYKFLSSFNAIYVKFSILNCKKQRQVRYEKYVVNDGKCKVEIIELVLYIYPFDSSVQFSKVIKLNLDPCRSISLNLNGTNR